MVKCLNGRDKYVDLILLLIIYDSADSGYINGCIQVLFCKIYSLILFRIRLEENRTWKIEIRIFNKSIKKIEALKPINKV